MPIYVPKIKREFQRCTQCVMDTTDSMIEFDENCPLFRGCSQGMAVARYHSLAADPSTMPDCLRIVAKTTEGEIMAVEHESYPIYGVQFHPESILTPQGRILLKNFICDCEK